MKHRISFKVPRAAYIMAMVFMIHYEEEKAALFNWEGYKRLQPPLTRTRSIDSPL